MVTYPAAWICFTEIADCSEAAEMRCKALQGLYRGLLGEAPGEFSTGLSTKLVGIRQILAAVSSPERPHSPRGAAFVDGAPLRNVDPNCGLGSGCPRGARES